MKLIHNIPLLYGLSLVLMAIATVIFLGTLPPEIPLFYSLPIGASQIVDIWYIIIIPITSLVIIMFNSLLLTRCAHGESLGKSIIYVANLSIIVLTLYIYLRIIVLVA